MKKNKPTIAVVTVNYNKEEKIKELISSLETSIFKDFRLYIVDNKSSDECISNLVKIINDSKLDIELILNEVNNGWGMAINRASKNIIQESIPFMLTINNDTRLHENAMLAFLKAMENPLIGICGSKILNAEGNVASCGGRIDWLTRLTGITRENKPRWKETELVILNDNEFVDDCAWFSRTKIMESVQYPPGIFLYFEELYIQRGAKRLGYKVAYNPQAMVYHA